MYNNNFRKKSQVIRSLFTLPLLFLITTLFIILTADVAFAKITKGPLLLRVAESRAALMWETDTQCPGKVSYGCEQESTKQVITIPQQVDYEIATDPNTNIKKTVFIHKTWLEGLQPGRFYSYSVADANSESKTYRFHTPSADTDEVKFVSCGDSQGNPSVYRKLVELMMSKNIDFVIRTGDMVSRGGRYEQWEQQLFEPLKGLAESVPVYAAKGNHDRSDKNYFETLLVPPGQSADYSFDYGPVHYYIADNSSDERKQSQILSLIASDMNDSCRLWKFVSYHKPSLNLGGHWSFWGYPNAMPTLSKAGVDFVTSGHSHQYERFRPVAPAVGTNGSFVTYITSGGGGGGLVDVTPVAYHAHAEKIHHFCLFHIKGNKLTMDAIDVDGRIIDHLEISKTNGRPDKQYLQTAVPMEAVRIYRDLSRKTPAAIAVTPQKSCPFIVTYQLSVPPLAQPAEITFELCSEQGNYQLPQPKTLKVPKEGGTIRTELTVTPLVEVGVPPDDRGRAKPIAPALWLDCHYQIDDIQEDVSHPIEAKSIN